MYLNPDWTEGDGGELQLTQTRIDGQDVQQQGVHGTLPVVHRRPLAALLCNTNTHVCHSSGGNK